MKVDTKLLWQAVKNVSVYSRKDGWAGAVKVDITTGVVGLTTSDDFVGITSTVPFDSPPRGRDTFWLSHDSVKELEKALRGKEGEVQLSLFDGDPQVSPGKQTLLRLEYVSVEESNIFDTIDCPAEDWWGMFDYVMDHVNAFPTEAKSWALDPARLSKMNLLEPKAEYPLALSNCSINGTEFVAFKYGPNTYGMIKPLDIEKLKEVYDRIEDVLWI